MAAAETSTKAGIQSYAAPQTLEEAARMLAAAPAAIVAGGTDLMVDPHGPWTEKPALLNIRRIEGLRGVAEAAGEISIGALTTVTDILTDPVVAARAPVLAATADRFASMQIRNMATVGGNICNASPAGDMIIPLLLLDAELDLVSWRDGALDTRTVALDGFFTGPGKTVIAGDELLARVRFAAPAAGHAAAFVKTGPRPALEIALVSMGLGGVKDGDVLREVRVAFGAVAPTPVRGRKTEAALEGRPLDGDTVAAALAAAAGEVAPISDVRASAWYRQKLVRSYLTDLIEQIG